MNSYPARLEELHAHLANAYGQRDRQATEILLCAILDSRVTGAARPWLIIETDWPSRDCVDAWFAFGGAGGADAMPLSLANPRVLRCDPAERMIRDWLETRKTGAAGLFVESEWRRLVTSTGQSKTAQYRGNYRLLMSGCVRLRVAHPRGDHALRPDRARDRAELARLARRVLDSELRIDLRGARTPSSVGLGLSTGAASTPKSFLYWCELLQRVSPHLSDWEMLTGSIAGIARSACTLYNDPDRGADWSMAERLIRDCVNEQTRWLMEQSSDGRGKVAWQMFRMQGGDLYNSTRTELRRLHRDGVIAATGRKPWRYRLASGDWKQLIDYGRSLF